MTTNTTNFWIVVYLIFTVELCEFDMYKCGQISECYEGIMFIHYCLKCIKVYCLNVCSKYMYYLQEHTIRTSSTMKGLSLWYDEGWYCHNLVYEYRSDNNPPKFWSPSTFGIIWSHRAGWSPYRLMVGSQLQRFCRSQESDEAWGLKTCNIRAIFDCVSDVTLSVCMWFCAAARVMEEHRMNFWGKFPEEVFLKWQLHNPTRNHMFFNHWFEANMDQLRQYVFLVTYVPFCMKRAEIVAK